MCRWGSCTKAFGPAFALVAVRYRHISGLAAARWYNAAFVALGEMLLGLPNGSRPSPQRVD